MLEVGHLVHNSEGAFGIVLTVHGFQAEVLWGNGLREMKPEEDLAIVPFQRGATIPASFPEMAAAYKTLRGFD